MNAIEHKGSLIWITGLANSGKTTVGKLLHANLMHHHPRCVYLDGDLIRAVLKQEDRHEAHQRLELAKSYARLAKLLVDQDCLVVFATVSMFHEVRDWNRENITGYFEVYLEVPLEILNERDDQGIYQNQNVVGVDIQAETPRSPDIKLSNSGERSPDRVAEEIETAYLKRFNAT